VDADKVVRVLQNLLDNAIKFSPAGGVVTLGVCHVDEAAGTPVRMLPSHHTDSLLVWVQDQGPGIPASYHGRIFEKFGQVRTQKLRGSGLGLTFCKLAIEAHGGQIWVESEEGRGSVFAFTLPLKHNVRSGGV
jgi:signal transduction histidine kinase